MPEKIKALLATGRISNLPTVWCNCLAASLIIFHLHPELEGSTRINNNHNLVILVLVISSSLLYVGGCFLGDAIDHRFDKEHKPERPIPSGILKQKTILYLSLILLGIGTCIPAIFHFLAHSGSYAISPKSTAYGWQQITAVPFLSLSIILYSIFHKRYPIIGLPLIGLCRFFLVIFAASISIWLVTKYELTLGNGNGYHEIAHTTSYMLLPILLFAAAVCIYTICFASVARTESSNSPITWRKILRYTMLGLPFITVISRSEYYGNYLSIAATVAFCIYALWLLRAFQFIDINKGKYVSKCLAGFCLLDACFVAQFGWIWLIICLALFGASLLLQRIAPAT